MADDLFDDWQLPSDDQWDGFELPEEPRDRGELLERMGRKLRHLRRDIAEVEAQAAVETARIRRIAEDRSHGSRRAAQWVTDTLIAAQRAVVESNRFAPKTMRLLCGVNVKANPRGGRPTIVDRGAYAVWATNRDLIKRDATVAVPWETLALVIQVIRHPERALEAHRLKWADDLDGLLDEQTVFTFPTYGEKDGQIRRRGDEWVDVETGEVVPGLGVTPAGYNFDVTIDEGR